MAPPYSWVSAIRFEAAPTPVTVFAPTISRSILLGLCLAFASALRADNTIQIGVNPDAGQIPIGPFIYGVNQDLPGVATPGARRQGGNRMTAYNWETNASNAGSDYYYESDNYMVSNLPANEQSTPAIAMTSFQDQSISEGSPYTVLTLRMENAAHQILRSNSGWNTGGNGAVLQAAASAAYGNISLANGDSAVLVTLPAGGYTALVSGVNGATGIGVVGIYELP